MAGQRSPTVAELVQISQTRKLIEGYGEIPVECMGGRVYPLLLSDLIALIRHDIMAELGANADAAIDLAYESRHENE